MNVERGASPKFSRTHDSRVSHVCVQPKKELSSPNWSLLLKYG